MAQSFFSQKKGKLLLALSWYGTVITTLAFAMIMLILLSSPRISETPLNSQYKSYRALPESFSAVQDVALEKADARAIIVEKFFESRNAPLAKHAQTFINVADQHGLDYRLLPAIAMQESNGGKRIPQDSYNPFGYGVYGSMVLKFDSFDTAIARVGKGLKEDYINRGLKTPVEIMAKYTPPALEKGGSWALGVNAFMEQLQ